MLPIASSAAQILSADDLVTEVVEVSQWGCAVRVRSMTAKDRDAFSESIPVDEAGTMDTTNYRSKLLARCIVDEGGNLLFTEDQVDALANKSAGAILTVFMVADRLNGISANAAKNIEKNSDAATSGGSTSASA
ncbi:MAG TPA: hypothetical protein DIT28_10080 [Oxalobacteraceae bacterium]|nr:hypothetical protein [Oxalobacteraceae bacterium]